MLLNNYFPKIHQTICQISKDQKKKKNPPKQLYRILTEKSKYENIWRLILKNHNSKVKIWQRFKKPVDQFCILLNM